MKKLLLIVPLLALITSVTAMSPCHSEEYNLASMKLRKMSLTKAQKQAIDVYAADFRKQWAHTHSTKGCSHHEAHAKDFVAAASGVLDDAQFKSFRNRKRSKVETVGHDIWKTGVYIDDLIKIAKKL